MDYSVDSDFNGVSGISNGSSITDQIEAAYQNNCLKDASELLTPERAKVLFDQDSDWENMTPEEFKAALELAKEQADESGIDADYAKEQLAQLEQAANADESIYRILINMIFQIQYQMCWQWNPCSTSVIRCFVRFLEAVWQTTMETIR